ncbi:pancreatic lipase-related protein 3-like [Diorhabda carinulata]|uniref:pancreatic lipase-related protein 3-like n=1 Tax=Diorhabda carinulata TaxID=1163345 RepID=UPI0025A1CC34|nr:pancreatic lipase-related protein 3-like [Diorhabda carinulata]
METELLWILVVLLNSSQSIKLQFGNCPIHFKEPCSSFGIKFILSMGKSENLTYHDLDPYQPVLPDNFDYFLPLKIVVHGYGGMKVDTAITNVTVAYQTIGYNIIIVDWEPLSALPCYITAYLNTWHVGQCLSNLAINLTPYGINPQLTHIVGFSLGAHIAGFAGTNIKNSLGISFMRITGLDPALPFFATFNNDWKLDPTDASFVDIIHTSAGTFGKLEAIGDADFYVNGGSLQPFCYTAKYPPICSHILSGLYFAESILNPGSIFLGTKCDSLSSYYLGFCESGAVAIMGEYTHFTTKGMYFVKTATNPPFALTLLKF